AAAHGVEYAHERLGRNAILARQPAAVPHEEAVRLHAPAAEPLAENPARDRWRARIRTLQRDRLEQHLADLVLRWLEERRENLPQRRGPQNGHRVERRRARHGAVCHRDTSIPERL